MATIIGTIGTIIAALFLVIYLVCYISSKYRHKEDYPIILFIQNNKENPYLKVRDEFVTYKL